MCILVRVSKSTFELSMFRLLASSAENRTYIFVVGSKNTTFFGFMKILYNSVINTNVKVPVHYIESGRVLSVNPARNGKWTVYTHPSSMSSSNLELKLEGVYER